MLLYDINIITSNNIKTSLSYKVKSITQKKNRAIYFFMKILN
jgi:hypothetical protein